MKLSNPTVEDVYIYVPSGFNTTVFPPFDGGVNKLTVKLSPSESVSFVNTCPFTPIFNKALLISSVAIGE